MTRRGRIVGIATVLALAGPLYAPEALAFPYHRTVRGAAIWSETPIPAGMDLVIARADALVQASPLATAPSGRRIFLTSGGWRWRWLSLTARGAFALTRPFSDAVVVNRSDVAADRVHNGAATGGVRTLSGVMAHERTHILVRRRYGELAAAAAPLWLREGYPDCVARESSLSDAQAARLRRRGVVTPALTYHDARMRVAAALAATGGSIDRLFAGS